ncbi:Receptor like protein 6, putative [Theobroma cacao]|uniref:Receptor like protein 6, putative n=1 Tax=Theobroma cacao TaxID=3641 RepID=A0A061F5C0_THECC|nr:Receptor like protein 6, putative [Theobroma cacao]
MWCLLKAFQLLHLLLFLLIFQANLSSSSSSITQLCSPEEAAALIQFKTSFSIDEYSSGECDESYPKTNSWKEGSDCCSWDGVTCDNIKGQVIGLDLSCSQLYGSIPFNSSLFHLPHLQKLNLAFNNFNYSEMSSKFGGFASLVYLNLSRSCFAGQVPSQISHLSKLVSLYLCGNYYQTIDKHTLEGLVENLTEVRQLFLGDINMSSINPNVLTNLSSSLRALNLEDCDLRGKFPRNIFLLSNLKSLYLGYNENLALYFPKVNRSINLQLLDLLGMSFSTDSIDSIGNLQSLKYLDLCGTSFPGGLPMTIMNLSSLEHLDASVSSFSGALPNSIGNLVSLEYLNLQSSNLSGSIPISLGNLSQLNHLDLSWNYFSGQIPSSLTNLRQLELLDISYNQLEGSIPDEVAAFPNLISLDFTFNSLNGTLPSWLYTASTLKYIAVRNNQLNGDVKEFQYKSLEEIFLENNKLTGPIPSSIFQFVNLTILDLSSNNLSGIVEFDMFSKLQNLQHLDLSYNSLSLSSNGTSANYTLPNLQSLHLSSCNVKEFPQFLKGSKSLQHLHLFNNKIYGKVPKWMLDMGKESLWTLNLSHNSLIDFEPLPWKKIHILDLSSNLIQGNVPIPPSTITFFFISNNSLSGEISSLICNVSSLRVLDLSHNNLSGIIPQCFGNLSKSLSVLKLEMNKFRGIIPPTFMKECDLSYLNLHGNQLEGPLTQSIINCRGLEVLDLGNNKINDTFPHWLGSLAQLQVLVLRSNKFHGSIHGARSSHSFSKIQIFDLSNNYFTGPLPVKYIKNFKAMANLTEDESVIGSYIGGHGSGGYSYSIGIRIKGVEIELVKIFIKLMIIDLSNNEFHGEIPEVIGELDSLKQLNLSHNNLNGCIPTSMGNLTALESLDLSSNKIVGKIPTQLTSLVSLEVLNLSQNQLVGPIPLGNQFNTFGNDSYANNLGLCGFPLSKSCDNIEAPIFHEEADPDSGFEWKVTFMGFGSGLVLGISAAYIMLTLGRPNWLVRMVEEASYKLKRYLRGRRNL